jgi:predicted acylesterase/phospholipase RssA
MQIAMPENSATDDDALCVSLSGGGHRASLFGLGALAYLVDAGLNRRVQAVSSVSGGSITNAYVAQECDFSTTTPLQFEPVIAHMLRTISGRGTLLASNVDRSIVTAFVAGLAVVLACGLFGWPFALSGGATVLGVVLLGAVALMRGKLLDAALGRYFFVKDGHTSTLGSIGRKVLHVFCATDLPTGAPFYFLAWEAGGFVFSEPHGAARADDVAVQGAVRASAAFPGAFPPKRLDLGPLERIVRTAQSPTVAYLADGGVWNNLGNQWFDDHAKEASTYFCGVPRRDGDALQATAGALELFEVARDALRYRAHYQGARTPSGQPILRGELPGTTAALSLVVNASSPLGRRKMGSLRVPLLAELAAFKRIVDLQYSNTVKPRVLSIVRREADAIRDDTRGTIADPAAAFDTDAVSGHLAVISVDDAVGRKASLTRHYALHLLGLWRDEGTTDRISAGGAMLKRAKQFQDYLERLKTNGSYAEPDAVARSIAAVPTTLSTVPATAAAATVAHGWFLAMEACHLQFGAPLLPYSGPERFLDLVRHSPQDKAP